MKYRSDEATNEGNIISSVIPRSKHVVELIFPLLGGKKLTLVGRNDHRLDALAYKDTVIRSDFEASLYARRYNMTLAFPKPETMFTSSAGYPIISRAQQG